MTCARSSDLSIPAPATYLQPTNLADYLSPQQNYGLILDIDGTLADFTINPKDSVIPKTTLILLQDLQRYGIKIAVVTGRSLTEAKQMIAPLQVPIAATHGLELFFADTKFADTKDSNKDNKDTSALHLQVDRIELAAIKQTIYQACGIYSDFTIEDKPYSVALHYRQNPTLADTAYRIMTKTIDNYTDWTLKPGKYVWEAVPKGADKGTAILALLKKMQNGDDFCPIFIGDDITDEAGFKVVQEINRGANNRYKLAQGMGIKVGSEPTSAHYYVNDIREVTVLLQNFLAFCQSNTSFFTHKNTARYLI